jgi:hypothetical protein
MTSTPTSLPLILSKMTGTLKQKSRCCRARHLNVLVLKASQTSMGRSPGCSASTKNTVLAFVCAGHYLIAFLPVYSFCSDFLWGCSYRILSCKNDDDVPRESTQLDHSRWASSNTCGLSCGILTVRLSRGVVLVQAELV